MDSNENLLEALFLDRDSRQTRAIERLDDAITSVLENQALSSQSLYRQIRELYAMDREQATEMEELRAMVRVMSQLLVDLGVDASVLRYRMEAAVEDVRAAAEERERQGKEIRCSSCSRTVPIRETNITQAGMVCDRCL